MCVFLVFVPLGCLDVNFLCPSCPFLCAVSYFLWVVIATCSGDVVCYSWRQCVVVYTLEENSCNLMVSIVAAASLVPASSGVFVWIWWKAGCVQP